MTTEIRDTSTTDSNGGESVRVRRREKHQLKSSRMVSEYARESFARLRSDVFDQGRPFAVAAAMSPHELFEAFELPFVTNEWWTSIVSGKQQSAYYFDWLEDKGFHDGLCGYASLSLATLLDEDNPSPPWGGLPRPSLLCSVGREGTEQLFDVVSRRLSVPFVSLDVPASTRFYPRWWEMSTRDWEDLYETDRIDVMVEGMRHLIEVLEDITGMTFDEDRLREICEMANQQQHYFAEVRELICDAPKTPVTFTEQLNNVLIPQWNRGTEWAIDHARGFRDEVRERAEGGVAAYDNEQIRLMWIGVGLWSDRDFYDEFHESHGAVFVRNMYLSLAADGYLKEGMRDPVRALAARYLNLGDQMHMAPWGNGWVVHEADQYRVDGAVMILPKSCHSSYVGTKFMIDSLEKAGVPTLGLWTDPVDTRQHNRQQLVDSVSEFLETRVAPIAPRRPAMEGRLA